MHVQVSTNNHVEGHDEFVLSVQATVEDVLSRFGDHITRVEVHIGDENGEKGGANDKRCAMEARPAGLKPVAVTNTASTVDEAVSGAAKKLQTLLDRTLGKLADHKGRTPFSGEPEA